MRKLRVRMLDGTVKTVLVDESQPVANLMVVICTKIGKCLSQTHPHIHTHYSAMNNLGGKNMYSYSYICIIAVTLSFSNRQSVYCTCTSTIVTFPGRGMHRPW